MAQSQNMLTAAVQKSVDLIQNGWQDEAMLPFLSLPEQYKIKAMVPKGLVFSAWGGTEQAERKAVCISREEKRPAVSMLQANFNPKFSKLSHKDVLGALMALGIERNVTGDIFIEDGKVYLFCLPAMKEYICTAFTSAGRTRLHFQECTAMSPLQQKRQKITVNCASTRVDAVTAALTKTSRKKAAEMIRAGLVKVNDVVLEENTSLCDNDFVSIRHCGRFFYTGIEKTTRKERLVLGFEKYM